MLLKTVVLVVGIVVAPALQAQETTDTMWSSAIPVWVSVKDLPGEPGAHEVRVAVEWDDPESTLFFAKKLSAGDIIVLLPTTEDADEDDLSDGCHFLGPDMDHGARGLFLGKRVDDKCVAPPARKLPLIGIKLGDSPMACKEAPRLDGVVEDDIQYFGCYWAEIPGG